MSAQHTPGPWEVGGDGSWVTGPDRAAPVICDLVPRDADVFTDEDDANADLIAAAPDLLVALRDLLADWEAVTGWVDCPPHLRGESLVHAAACAAVAKAEGGAE